jgi:hypothetical protein
MKPQPVLAETHHLIGDDGKPYTVHGYKDCHRGPTGEWIEDDVVSILLTDKGQRVECMQENPLTFIILSSGVILQPNPSSEPGSLAQQLP